jgi:hypothetical protein
MTIVVSAPIMWQQPPLPSRAWRRCRRCCQLAFASAELSHLRRMAVEWHFRIGMRAVLPIVGIASRYLSGHPSRS